jgi:hypothetical protein
MITNENDEFPNSLKVGSKYRTNPLSKKPGGVTVIVQHPNGFTKEYDKVKYPKAFMIKILESNEEGTQCWIKD